MTAFMIIFIFHQITFVSVILESSVHSLTSRFSMRVCVNSGFSKSTITVVIIHFIITRKPFDARAYYIT